MLSTDESKTRAIAREVEGTAVVRGAEVDMEVVGGEVGEVVVEMVEEIVGV